MIKQAKATLVLQHDQSDCGVASLKSIICYHGGSASLERLRELSGTHLQGTTLLGLFQAAQQMGFQAEGLQAESIDNLKELNNPAILHVIVENYLQHYFVFYGFDNEKVIIGDPAKGIVLYAKHELDKLWKSKALLKLTPASGAIKKGNDRAVKTQWIFGLLKKDAELLVISLFLGIVVAALALSTAIFSQKLIDNILPDGDSMKLILSIVLVALLLTARAGLGYLRGFFILSQGMNFNNRIIASFYSALLWLPKSFFDTRKIGELVARMNDTRRIQAVISSLTGNLLIDLLLVIVSLAFVFAYSWMVGCVLLLGTVLVFLIAATFNPAILKAQKDVLTGYAITEAHYVDSMQGINDIKSNQRELFFEQLNKMFYEAFQTTVFSLGKLGIRFAMISELIGIATLMSVFGLSSWMVLSKNLQLGEMVALLGMSGNIMPSVTRLAIANIQIQEARVAFERMYEFTSISPEEPNTEEHETNDLTIFDGGINLEVKDIAFRFPGRPQILKNVSISLRSGEWHALLGETGGGKSTLLQLLQKFYIAEAGSIDVNGIPLSQIKVKDWRSKIGFVPQDVKIFNGTLLYNITLSDQQSDNERAINFCNQNGFDRFFLPFATGYLTLVGEDGINLSGGQKQIVALARALFRTPKLLLLDEATSAMDRETENFVLDLLLRLKPNLNILFVTHRLKTAQRADRIYVLENGTITSSGSPAELMLTDNFFSASYRELIAG